MTPVTASNQCKFRQIQKKKVRVLDQKEESLINVYGIFAPGQIYTGLSRFESFDYLQVLNYVKGKTQNIVSKDVINFYPSLKTLDTSICSVVPPSNLGCCKASSQTQGIGQAPVADRTQRGPLPTDSSVNPQSDSARDDPEEVFSAPVHGPFAFTVSLTTLECLNKLSCCYLDNTESNLVASLCNVLKAISQSPIFYQLFNQLLLRLWLRISDIVYLAPSSRNDLDNFCLTKEEACGMYLDVQDLVLDDSLFSHLKFLLSDQVLKDILKLEDRFINKVLFDLIMLIYKTITEDIFSEKSKCLLDKVRGGEIYKTDYVTNEGLAVIRHLGGWAVRSVVANLSHYILSFSSSRNQVTQKKVDLAVKMCQEIYTSLIVPAAEIHESTLYKETLQHTDYYNRGALTFKTDNCYLFFVELEKSSEKLLQKFVLLETGENFVEKSINLLYNDSSLRNYFLALFSSLAHISPDSLHCNEPETATTSVSNTDVGSVSDDISHVNVIDNVERCVRVSSNSAEACSPALSGNDSPFSLITTKSNHSASVSSKEGTVSAVDSIYSTNATFSSTSSAAINRSYKADNIDYQFSASNRDDLMDTDATFSPITLSQSSFEPAPNTAASVIDVDQACATMVQLVIHLMTQGAVLGF